jgi:hypothetical protein
MKDLKNNIAINASLLPVSQTAAVNGASVDLQGYNSACVEISAGQSGGTTPDFTFEVQESDDDSTFTAVAAADLQGTEPQITTANDNAVYRIGYIGNSRYIRTAITAVTGTSPTLVCGSNIIRGHAEQAPVA